MAWNLSSDRPIYAQILEILQIQIVTGLYKPGDKFPSVRELASTACVNPNTMQKALTELEKSGLITTQRTSGRTVTGDQEMIKETQMNLANEQIKAFIEKMNQLGYKKEDIISLIQSSLKEEKE